MAYVTPSGLTIGKPKPVSLEKAGAPVTLSGFVLARILEDEWTAREATRWTFRSWDVQQHPYGLGIIDDTEPLAELHSDGPDGLAVANQIVRWDPERVRAECVAKKRIVDEWRQYECARTVNNPSYNPLWNALKALALPYANHPDYNPDWAAN